MHGIWRWLVLVFGFLAHTALAEQRNVMLIISDDQGRDLGIYGDRLLRTPHLDALARRGTWFTHAFATVSSCSPSRSVIFSGLYSHANGMYGLAHDVHNQHLLPDVETLPVWLKRAGYRTALVGKKHIRPEEALPFDAELAPERAGVRDVAFMAQQAQEFIAADRERPFFIVVAFSDPHRAPENFGNTRAWPNVERVRYDPSEIEPPPHLPDLPAVREDLAHYYESISRLDAGVGMLLDALRATERDKDTLVVFLSDNGRPFPGAKTTLYDAGIHLPLIVFAPGRKQGVRNEAMVSWIDIAPTILDWTRAAGPETYSLSGRSLLPILETPRPAGWDRTFASHVLHEIHQYYPMRALRTQRYKYIVNLAPELSFPIAGDVVSSASWQAILAHPDAGVRGRSVRAYQQRPAEELYDLEQDPDELNNVAGDPKRQDDLARLRNELNAFRERTKDPWLAPASAFDHLKH